MSRHETQAANRLRVVIGFLVAPLVGPAVWLLFTANDMKIAGAITFLGVGYVVALLAGVPLFLLLRHFELRRLWHFLIGGAVLGYLPVLLMLLSIPHEISPAMILVFNGYGAVSGGIFWWIALARTGSHGVA